MDFQTFVGEELSALAVRLSEAASEEQAQAARDLIATHAAALADLTSRHDTDIRDRDASHERAVLELEARHQAAIEQLDSERQLSIGRVKAEHESATGQLASTRLALDAARDQIERVTQENERIGAQLASLTAEHEALRGMPSVDRRAETLQRLLAAFDRMARSATTDEVLAAGVRGLADDFARVAVFAVGAGSLEVRHHHGFGVGSDVDAVSIPRDDHSMVARALHQPGVQRYTLADFKKGTALPFPGSPQSIVLAPVAVRGEVTALIYADNEGPGEGLEKDDEIAVASLLQQHTALRLERLALELKAIAELRAYARMLVDEIEYVYAADVSAGRSDRERLDHLRDNLRCSRQIYGQRVTLEGPATTSLLDDAITGTLTDKGGTPFANDLGTVLLEGDADPAAADNAA
jgi:hypothetical protein